MIKKLFKLTTKGLGDYYVVHTDYESAKVLLEKQLDLASYGFSSERYVINIELITNEIVPMSSTQTYLNFSDKSRLLIGG